MSTSMKTTGVLFATLTIVCGLIFAYSNNEDYIVRTFSEHGDLVLIKSISDEGYLCQFDDSSNILLDYSEFTQGTPKVGETWRLGVVRGWFSKLTLSQKAK